MITIIAPPALQGGDQRKARRESLGKPKQVVEHEILSIYAYRIIIQ